ncbi:hypothetical protein [Streptosporangium sp. NPDC002524]|uniref:hypothetical protein n=1 Tax=Streptosporangium sp. NPDC002524 TaxID=3154537 RepID=UPI00332F652F
MTSGGTLVAVGAPHEDADGTADSGAVYLFDTPAPGTGRDGGSPRRPRACRATARSATCSAGRWRSAGSVAARTSRISRSGCRTRTTTARAARSTRASPTRGRSRSSTTCASPRTSTRAGSGTFVRWPGPRRATGSATRWPTPSRAASVTSRWAPRSATAAR